jgi:hypothetical protein
MMKPRPSPTFTTQAELGKARGSLLMAIFPFHVKAESISSASSNGSPNISNGSRSQVITAELAARGELFLDSATHNRSRHFAIDARVPRDNMPLSPE